MPARGVRLRPFVSKPVAEWIDGLQFASHSTFASEYLEAAPKLTDIEAAYFGCVDRFYLLTNLLRRPDANHPWLYERCREVEAEPDDRLDLWARYHYKSTIITFAGVIQEILNNPEITIGIFGFSKDIARPFLRQIQEEFESNEPLKALYPDVLWRHPRKEAPMWSRESGIVVRRKGNPKEATVEAYGLIDGMPTGRHFMLRVYDDLINEKAVTNEEQVRKATLQWEMSQNLGTTDGGRRWHIGTRYSFADSYGVLIERGSVAPRLHPATDDGTLRGRPVLLTVAQWEKVKRDQRATAPAQMLQNPVAGQDNTFDLHHLRSYEVRPATMNVYIVGDPSLGRRKGSDRTAIAVIGVDVNANRYLLDGACHRMKLSDRYTTLRDLWKKWKAHPGVQTVAIGWERYGLQADTEYFEEKAIQDKLNGFIVEEVNWTNENDQSKKARVGRLEPYFRESQFYLPARVWHAPRRQECTWRIADGADVDEGEDLPAGAVILYEEAAGFSKAERKVIANGERHRLLKPLRRMDQDGNAYDLTRLLFEQYAFFPFAPYDDLIDAVSRIEDVNPTPPMLVEAFKAMRQKVHTDA